MILLKKIALDNEYILSVNYIIINTNIQKNKATAKSAFPNEQWVNVASIKLAQEGADFEIPNGVDNIKIAKSRVTPSKNHSNISDREQGENVFIRVMNPNITSSDVIRKIYGVVNGSHYTGGFKGNMIFSVRQGNFETLHYTRIGDLKKATT